MGSTVVLYNEGFFFILKDGVNVVLHQYTNSTPGTLFSPLEDRVPGVILYPTPDGFISLSTHHSYTTVTRSVLYYNRIFSPYKTCIWMVRNDYLTYLSLPFLLSSYRGHKGRAPLPHLSSRWLSLTIAKTLLSSYQGEPYVLQSP